MKSNRIQPQVGDPSSSSGPPATTFSPGEIQQRHTAGWQANAIDPSGSSSAQPNEIKNPDRSKNLTTVGGLAEACGIGPGTIRHYQNIGLIPKPARAQYGGFRRYSQEDVERLSLIHLAQEIGFTLKEVGDILRYRKKGDFPALGALIALRKNAIQNEILALKRNLENLGALSGTQSVQQQTTQSTARHTLQTPSRATPDDRRSTEVEGEPA